MTDFPIPLVDLLARANHLSPHAPAHEVIFALLGKNSEDCCGQWRPSLTPTDAAYLAGIIDGEGCIRFDRQASRGRPGRIYPCIFVVNTDFELLNWIKKTVGAGDICDTPRPKDKPQWSAVRRWRLSGIRVIPLLMLVEPFIKVKFDQMLLAYGWSADRALNKHATAETIATEQFLFDSMKWLNKRGSDARQGSDPGTLLMQKEWNTLLPWAVVNEIKMGLRYAS